MKVNQLKAGSIIGYVQMALSVLISILYTPVMIRMLGKGEYGIYTTVISTIAMLTVLNLGFNASYVRFFMTYHAKGDREGEYRLNGLYMTVFLVIGAIALVCGLFLSFNLELILDKGFTQAEYALARRLMILLTVNTAIGFPMGVFSAIITAYEKYICLKLVASIKTVVSPLVMILVLMFGLRSTSMVITTLVLSLVADVIYIYYTFCVLKVKFIFSKSSVKLFGSIFAFSGFIAINIIVDQINNNVDKLLIGRFLGSESVAVYAVGFTLYSGFLSIAAVVPNLFIPKVHNIVNTVEDECERNRFLTSLLIKVGRIQFYVLGLVASGFLFFGKPFVKIWSRIKEYETAYIVAAMLILSVMLFLCQSLGIEIQRAKNLHKFRSIAYLIMALFNIVATIILCQLFGIVGAVIGTAASFFIANGLIMNIYYHKKIGLDMIEYWKNILRAFIGFIPPYIYGFFVMFKVEMNSYFDIVKYAVPFVIIYAVSVWFLSMNKYEHSLITSVFNRFIKKKVGE